MAMFKQGSRLWQSTCEAFEDTYAPGSEALWTGIYACQECQHEIVSYEGALLPPASHHHHASGRPIRWTLIVYADQRPQSVSVFPSASPNAQAA